MTFLGHAASAAGIKSSQVKSSQGVLLTFRNIHLQYKVRLKPQWAYMPIVHKKQEHIHIAFNLIKN